MADLPVIRIRPPRLSIIDAMADPNLFGPWFQKAQTWRAWRAFLRALFGLHMSQEDLLIYQDHTARAAPPTGPAREAWLIVGRRGGKSCIVALIAVFLACFRDYRQYLAPGERGVVMVLAADRKQARVIFRYARALLKGIDLLRPLIAAERADAIELTNGIDIEIHTASYRSVRGYAVVAALLDEVAFWPADDAADPDAEIVAALRPAMSTIPGALLIGISSPYARRGVLWEAYRDHHGKDSDVLVWQADSRSMNPTLPQSVVDRAYQEDPLAAAAEYGAEFRRDVEMLFSAEAVEAVTIKGRHELPPASGLVYRAFVDPSGGGSDSMTLAIAHANPRSVRELDLLRERRPPFSPESVVKEFAEVLKAYGLSEVTGDRYAGEWPRERFQKEGISYRTSDKTKSEIYTEFLPVVTSGQAALLDHDRLHRQLIRLERRTSRAGKDSIDHAPGGHDDLANVCAGALVLAKPTVAIDLERGAFVADAEAAAEARDQHFIELERAGTSGNFPPWN